MEAQVDCEGVSEVDVDVAAEVEVLLHVCVAVKVQVEVDAEAEVEEGRSRRGVCEGGARGAWVSLSAMLVDASRAPRVGLRNMRSTAGWLSILQFLSICTWLPFDCELCIRSYNRCGRVSLS